MDAREELELRRKLAAGVSPREELDIRRALAGPAVSQEASAMETRKRGAGDAFINQFTGGILDEVGAVGGATGRWLRDKTLPKDEVPAYEPQDKTWLQHYKDVYDREVRSLEDYKKENPVTGTVAEIAGGIASPIARALSPFSKTIGPGAGTFEKARKIGADAGIQGLLYGATNTEGDLADRAVGSLIGGGLSAGIGAGSVPIVEGAAAGIRKAVQAALDRYGTTDAGQRKAVQAIARANGGDVRAAIAEVKAALGQGDDLAIADVAGINAQRIARAAANVPGKSSQIADDFVSTRAAGRGGRMQAAADKLSPNRFYENLDELNAVQKTGSEGLYREAFAPRSDKAGKVYVPWDARLQQFLDDPIVREGMGKGVRVQQLEALAEGKPFNFQEYAVKGFNDDGSLIIEGTPNLRAMDAAKRGLDEILEQFRNPTTGKLDLTEYGRAVEKVRKALVSKLDDITTDEAGRSAYKEARQQWAGPAAIKDAMWMGRRFMRGDEEMTKKAFDGLSDSQKEAFRVGVRREIGGAINADTQAAPGRFADKKADLWARLRSIFPPKDVAAFRNDITREQKMLQTEKMVSPRAGSHTTPMKEDIDELSRFPSWMLDSIEGVSKGTNSFGSILDGLKPMVRGPLDALRRPNEQVAESVADTLLSLDKNKQKAFFDNAEARRYAEDVLPFLKSPARTRLEQFLARGGAVAASGD